MCGVAWNKPAPSKTSTTKVRFCINSPQSSANGPNPACEFPAFTAVVKPEITRCGAAKSSSSVNVSLLEVRENEGSSLTATIVMVTVLVTEMLDPAAGSVSVTVMLYSVTPNASALVENISSPSSPTCGGILK
eukprot:2282675-Rhodomonas_salina.1